MLHVPPVRPETIRSLILSGSIPKCELSDAVLNAPTDEWVLGRVPQFDNLNPVQVQCPACLDESDEAVAFLCPRLDTIDPDRLWIPIYLGVCPTCGRPHLLQATPPYIRLPRDISCPINLPLSDPFLPPEES